MRRLIFWAAFGVILTAATAAPLMARAQSASFSASGQPLVAAPTPTPAPIPQTGSPSTLVPAPDTEIKFSGDFRVRYESDIHANAQSASQNAPASTQTNGQTAQGKAANQSDVEHRLKLNVFVRHGENLQAGATVINAAVWGERPATGDSSTTDPNSSQIPGSRSGVGTSDNQILINRAWGWWKASDTLSFKFGRVGLEIADGSVFSENDWEQFPVSHDGLLSFWDSTIGRFTLFAIKNNEFGTGFLAYDAERITYGISFDVKNLPSYLSMVNVHVLQIVQDEAYLPTTTTGPATQKENSERVGIAIGGDTGPFNYKFDGVYAFGKTSGQQTISPAVSYVDTINAWMLDISAGYKALPFWGMKLVAGFHKDSGDRNPGDSKSQQYEPLYYNRHDNAGLMDVLNWGNLTYYTGGVTAKPRSDIETGAMYYWFQKTSAAGPTSYGARYVDANLPAPTGGGQSLGSEIDLYIQKSFDAELFHVGLRGGTFIPGAAIRNSIATGANSHIYELFAQASMVF